MYSFTNMRQFVIDAIEKDDEGTLTDADGEYVLTPSISSPRPFPTATTPQPRL